jgi:hypothetical protein
VDRVLSAAPPLEVAAEAVLLPAVPAALLRLLRRLELLVADGLGTKYLQYRDSNAKPQHHDESTAHVPRHLLTPKTPLMLHTMTT